jgi:acetolactate synthase-1/2/3 large subunit
MGYGLPAAIGACMGAGGKPILAVESDGSLQLNVQELATLSAQKLPVCLFVMNNGGYASIRNTQRNYFSGRYLGSDAASGLGQPDLKALAAGYGVGYARIDDAADLAAQLERVMELPRPCLIDVHLQADEVLQPKCAAIPQPGGGMLSMPLEDMSPLMSLVDLRHEMMVPLSEASLRAREHSA